MRIRDYTPSDMDALQKMFTKQGLKYKFPKLESCVIKKMVVDQFDTPRQALLARPTVELYFLQDDFWMSPMYRFAGLAGLHRSVGQDLLELGFTDANIWVSPSKAKTFGRRLERSFGWRENAWKNYAMEAIDGPL